MAKTHLVSQHSYRKYVDISLST